MEETFGLLLRAERPGLPWPGRCRAHPERHTALRAAQVRMSAPYTSSVPSSPLTLLADTVRVFNAYLRPGDLPVTLSATGTALTLASALRREVFALADGVLIGRGGTFDLTDPAQCQLAISTVQPTEAVEVSGALAGEATRLGLRVRAGRTHRWKYAFMATPLHLIHPDGRTLWAADFESDDVVGSARRLIASGHALFAAQHDGDEEDFMLMRRSDEQTAQDIQEGAYPEGTVPHELPVYIWPLRGAALDALLAGQAPDPADLVPEGFAEHPEQFGPPAASITRDSLRAAPRPRTPTLDALAEAHFGGDRAATRALLSALTNDVLRTARAEQHHAGRA